MKTSLSILTKQVRYALATSLALSAVSAPVAFAQEEDTNSEKDVEKIAVVGSRAAPRSVGDSAVPLDIIGSDELKSQGASDMLSILTSVVPSLNVNDQPINDASSLVRPANLRGMASDHTLILVNGKRRHRSAVITFLGGGLSDGAQGPDIANIPASAIKQVEVLRDGAAAQYGSDAIAGVVNFALNDSSDGGFVEAKYGSYYEGDGDTYQVMGNVGLPLTKDGFANLSFEYREADATSRSVQRGDAAQLIADGNTAVAEVGLIDNIAQIWGTPETKYDYKLAGNFGLELGNDDRAYMFFNWSEREIEGGFYYRNPHNRGGVNDGGMVAADVNNDGKIDLDEDGNPIEGYNHLLVGDLTSNLTGNCPKNIRTGQTIGGDYSTAGYNVLTDPLYISQVANNPNCFAFNELLPGGFTPRFGGVISDAAIVMGTSGEFANEWMYDISVGLGYSRIEFAISNTINPSLGPDTPRDFSPGTASQLEKNFNVDLSKAFNVDGFDGPINLATGFEWRRENFKQEAGDPASFAVGSLAFDPATGQSQGFGIGSNGFPGYKPESAGDWGRGNIAFYVDVESYVTEDFLVGAAARYEDFTDFGSTFTGKLSARYQLTDAMALRGAFSTGFKAPTVGQNNVINVTTAFAAGGLEDQATLPPSNPISVQKGATPLDPEESTNYSFGWVGEFENGIYMTIDYFNIKLEDRISTTSALALTQTDIDVLLNAGVRDATSFSSVKYFTNDFDTTTQGIDIVMNYSTELFGGDTKFALAYNWTDTKVDKVRQFTRTDENGKKTVEQNLTAARIEMIEDNLPAHRATFSINQTYDQLSAQVRLNYYGKYYEDHLDAAAGLDIYAGSEFTVDMEVGYHFTEQLKVALGAKNLLDNEPDENPFATVVGSKFPATSPMGINGGFYYLRGTYNF